MNQATDRGDLSTPAQAMFKRYVTHMILETPRRLPVNNNIGRKIIG